MALKALGPATARFPLPNAWATPFVLLQEPLPASFLEGGTSGTRWPDVRKALRNERACRTRYLMDQITAGSEQNRLGPGKQGGVLRRKSGRQAERTVRTFH